MPLSASRRRVVLGLAGALAAAGLTVLWLTVVPGKAETTAGLQAVAIRYGHPATWALLCLLGLLVATNAPPRSRTVVGGLSLGCYAVFLTGLAL